MKPIAIKLDDLLSRLPDLPETALPGLRMAPDEPRQSQATRKSEKAIDQARRWIKAIQPAIEGQGGNQGEKQAFGVAVGLVQGFDLPIWEALDLLREWNTTCQPPFTEFELRRKIEEAERAPQRQPRGWHLRRESTLYQVDFSPLDGPSIPEAPPPLDPKGREAAGEGPKKVTAADLMASGRAKMPRPELHGILDDPAELATQFDIAYEPAPGKHGYKWWRGQFFHWDNAKYVPVEDDYFDSILFWHCNKLFTYKYLDDINNAETTEEANKIKKKKVTGSLLAMVKTALRELLRVETDATSEPFWADEPFRDWRPADIIPFSNRLVHLPSFASGEKANFIKKTPDYFCTWSLTYPFNYDAYEGLVAAPPELNKFLLSIWPDDPESIRTFQEILGYLLTSSNEHHKIFMLIGPPRSGKGTILQLINNILGVENVAAVTFGGLAGPFGKESLIGKSAAIFPDARLSGRTDVAAVVETILSISGGDYQEINRKHRPAITQKLNCRFVISSNVLPRLTETSGALVSRAIILRFTNSFLGKEDKKLGGKLMAEIPQIARWAIDGWTRLQDRGEFVQPEAGRQLVADMMHLSSPILHFAEQCLDLGAEYETNTKQIFTLYKWWCEYNNREHIGDLSRFEADLTAALPQIRYGDPVVMEGETHAWSRLVKGARVKPETDTTTGGIDWTKYQVSFSPPE